MLFLFNFLDTGIFTLEAAKKAQATKVPPKQTAPAKKPTAQELKKIEQQKAAQQQQKGKQQTKKGAKPAPAAPAPQPEKKPSKADQAKSFFSGLASKGQQFLASDKGKALVQKVTVAAAPIVAQQVHKASKGKINIPIPQKEQQEEVVAEEVAVAAEPAAVTQEAIIELDENENCPKGVPTIALQRGLNQDYDPIACLNPDASEADQDAALLDVMTTQLPPAPKGTTREAEINDDPNASPEDFNATLIKIVPENTVTSNEVLGK